MAIDPEERRQLDQIRNSQKVNLNKSISKERFNDAASSYLAANKPSNQFEYVKQNDNPLFLWPESTTRTMGGAPYKPVRGYIRRLNEFYDRMSATATDIQGRRCNFQFQPETIVRSVTSNSYDTQYFFNQDPSQLTVPIPGQSTYGLKLLFNREAEVTSGYYKTGNTVKYAGSLNSNYDPLVESANEFIEGNYRPDWVTRIGVLADIMVLDGVIGQGISKETLTTIQKIAEAQKSSATAPTTTEGTDVDSEDTKDEQDKTESIKSIGASYWLDNISSVDNPNLGNQAFLVPTPVRIMLSNYMMIEGFVLSSSVNFHKFSKKFVPTQATVELSIQALYIGFAKKTTMLTEEQTFALDQTSSPDSKPKSEADKAVEQATLDGVRSMYKTVSHHKGGKDLLNYILKSDPQQSFNFTLRLSESGSNYRINTLAKDGGGDPSFHWNGTISIHWDSYINGASNSRQPTRTSASGGSLVKGYPTGFEQWGTFNNPLVIATGSGQIYESIPLISDKLNVVSNIDHIIGDNDSDIFGTSGQEEAKWDMSLPPSISPRPFEQDKFRVKLEITVTLQRHGNPYPLGQKITFDKIVTCGEDSLFNNLSLSTASQT